MPRRHRVSARRVYPLYCIHISLSQLSGRAVTLSHLPILNNAATKRGTAKGRLITFRYLINPVRILSPLDFSGSKSHDPIMSHPSKVHIPARSIERSKFSLREARPSDLSSIARVWHRAFFDDEVIGNIMHPKRQQYPEDVYYFLLNGVRERFWDWRHQFMVIVTVDEYENEAIVGAADWRRLGKGGAQRELPSLDPRNLIAPAIHGFQGISGYFCPNRAADPTRTSFLDTAIAASEIYWTGDRAECWDLHVCGVDPDYQGKGVGKQLAQWGVKEAEKEGFGSCASVLCGEKNRGFYRKAGFVIQVGGKADEGDGIVLFTR